MSAADVHPLAERMAGGWEVPAKHMPKAADMNLKPSERNEFGVTVSIREQKTRRWNALVANGPVRDALRQVCGQIDAMEGDWKIVSISTPATIFRDLQGARDPETPPPEKYVLTRIGRMDLLEQNKPRPNRQRMP